MLKKDMPGSRIFLRFLSLALIGIILVGCRYNFYLAEQYREKEDYEIAQVYYQRTYLESDIEKYVEAYKKNSADVERILLERYRKYIDLNDYNSAYSILRRLISLNYGSPEVQEETLKWAKILVAGSVQFEFDALREFSNRSGNTSLIIRVNTPIQDRILETEINPITGVFFAIDYIYNPPEEFLLFYTINSIGVNQDKLLDSFTSFVFRDDPAQGGGTQRANRANFDKSLTSLETEKFVNYYIPVPTDAKIDLSGLSNGKFSFLSVQPAQAELPAQLNAAEPGVRFSVGMSGQNITVSTESKSIDFLPQILFKKSEEQRYFLDFGQILLQRDNENLIWRVKREFPGDPVYRSKLASNLILRPFLFELDGAFQIVRG